jgi:aryl-alcohol dehydrogenase-like predicted oxidoreductase
MERADSNTARRRMAASTGGSMEYTHLGRTGLKVSRLCVGTMNFGVRTPEKSSFAIMDRALELGVNFFDTANVYGGRQYEGYTEQIVGKWLARDQAKRDRIVLATKVFGTMGPGPNDHRLSAYHIRRACEESLRRLQTDRIDLYQFHHVDRETPWEEIWQAMDLLVQAGKVIYVGSSNFAGWNIAQAQEVAKHRRSMGLVSEQSLYNLAQRSVELEVIPACRAYGLGLIPYSPLAGGLLGGVLKERPQGGRRQSDRIEARVGEYRKELAAYEDLCSRIGHDPGEVALAWLLRNEVVTAPIIGPRTVEQLESAHNALSIELSGETLDSLDDIWSGPGGEAPMAYAW